MNKKELLANEMSKAVEASSNQLSDILLNARWLCALVLVEFGGVVASLQQVEKHTALLYLVFISHALAIAFFIGSVQRVISGKHENQQTASELSIMMAMTEELSDKDVQQVIQFTRGLFNYSNQKFNPAMMINAGLFFLVVGSALEGFLFLLH